MVQNGETSDILVATGFNVKSSLHTNLLAVYGTCIGDFILADFGLFHIFFTFFCTTFIMNMHPFFKKSFYRREKGREKSCYRLNICVSPNANVSDSRR